MEDKIKKARELVVKFHAERIAPITYDETLVVWACKTLQNHKTIIATTHRDGMLYEVTHNGDTGHTYLDAYYKLENRIY